MKCKTLKKGEDIYKVIWEITNPTFLDKRECEYCYRKIPDEAKADQTYCPDHYNHNGKFMCCRQDYFERKNADEKLVLNKLLKKHKKIKNKIEEILSIHGSDISTNVLDIFDIKLSDRIFVTIDSAYITFQFLKYQIKTNKFTRTHQIIKNG